MKYPKAIFSCAFILALAMTSSYASYAQVLYGSIVGTVSDPDEKPVPNAKITVRAIDTGGEQQQITDDRGNYGFRSLQPGTYSLMVEAPGFRKYEVPSFLVSNNVTSRQDSRLTLGSADTSIEVNADSAQMQTDSGDVHSELTSKELTSLPVTGYRNYQSLINLVPGATPAQLQNSVFDTPARSLTTNINGTSRYTNTTSVDGAAIQMPYLPHHTLYNPPLESIQSVNIATNSFNAEQGLAGGAVVTVITKSGTNDFHGSLFEVHSDSDMVARNYFYKNANTPKNILNQPGFSLGGPILRKKLFFFTGFEGMIQRQNFSNFYTVPTLAERNGDFSGLGTVYDPSTGAADGSSRTAFKDNQIPTARMSQPALRMLALIPLPNQPGATTNNYFNSATYGINRFSGDEKITWQIDPRSSLFSKYSVMEAAVTGLSSLGAGGGTGLTPGSSLSGHGHNLVQVAGLGYTRQISNVLLVDGSFGFGRNYVNVVENDYGTNFGLNYLGIPGTNGSDPRQSGLPSFAVTGFETFGNADSATPEVRNDYVYTFTGNLSWQVRSHNLRFGASSTEMQMNEFQPQRGFGPRGGFTFTGGVTSNKGGASSALANSFAQFLLGLPDSLGKSYQYLNPITLTEWQHGIYAQDQWQVTRKLTATYGVRWEYYPIIHRANRGLERYDLATNQVLLGGIGNIPSGGGTTANPHQFAPRLGLAYRLNDKTVLRAGYGISIDPFSLGRAMRDPYPVTVAQTINSTSSYLPASTLEAGIPAIAAINYGNGTIAMPLDAYTKTLLPGQFPRGYIESWNAAGERELPLGFDLSIAYVGTQSIRVFNYIEANAGQIAGAGSAGQPLYTQIVNGVQEKRAAETQTIVPYGSANYNSLQTSLKHRFQNGFLITAAYTYSKSIDQAPDSVNPLYFFIPGTMQRNRAVSDFDRRHNLQIGFSAALPFGHNQRWLNQGKLISGVASGWQINGTIAHYTGLPFTTLASGTSLNAPFNTQVADQLVAHPKILGGVGSGATWFDTTAFATVSQARFGTASRNNMRGPNTSDLDLSLFRKFDITERLKFEMRGEAFNLTNTPAFALPANNASSGSFGHITQTFGGTSDSRVLRVSGRVSF